MPKKRTEQPTTQPVKVKTPKHTSKDISCPNTINPDFESFFDYSIWKKTPIDNDGIMRKAQTLLYWARNSEDALTITQWYALEGVNGTTVNRWKERCPEFKDAFEMARRCIGARREVLALTRKIDGGMVQYSMPAYSDEWKELVEWKEKVRATYRTQEEAPKIVVIERYGSREGKDSGVDISVHPESNLEHVVVEDKTRPSKGKK